MERPAAKERQKDHGGTAPGKGKNTCGKLPQLIAGRTREKVGEAIGVSGKTYEKAKQVAEAGQPPGPGRRP